MGGEGGLISGKREEVLRVGCSEKKAEGVVGPPQKKANVTRPKRQLQSGLIKPESACSANICTHPPPSTPHLARGEIHNFQK